MKTKIIILALVALFSFSINAQTKQKAPLKFNIEKTLANIEKISSQDLIVQLKGNIIEEIDATHYWFKDETGRIKITVDSDQLNEVGEYNENTIFYIFGNIESIRDETFKVSDIKKAE